MLVVGGSQCAVTSKEGVKEINAALIAPTPSFHQCPPLAKPTKKPEGKGALGEEGREEDGSRRTNESHPALGK